MISKTKEFLMYKMYVISDVERLDCLSLAPYLRYLPEDRREKASQFRRDIDRKNCVISYWLLQYGLYKDYGIRSFSLLYDRNNKPYLSDYPHIHFSISHCDYGCICAIADNPVGVDIQEIRPFSWSVAKHCCSAEEIQLLKNSDVPADEFTKIWTKKESFLKMKGTGILCDLRTVDTIKFQEKVKTFVFCGCYISIASAEFFQEEEI